MRDTDERLRTSVAGYVQKHDDDVFDEISAEDWIRADVESWEIVSPSRRAELIAEGVRMVHAAVEVDRVTDYDLSRIGAQKLGKFLVDVADLQRDADALDSRSRDLLHTYAGHLVDAAQGSLVKEEYLRGYVSGEVAGWPDVEVLPTGDRYWLEAWLMKMIEAEYKRVRRKQGHP
ncbi:hypothetical protein [Pararhizobium sp.]|uniref:hypothetical protein n=1 Tax=Pararhizobium sp. TaxID=1977563 RepID=UPI003D0D76EE